MTGMVTLDQALALHRENTALREEIDTAELLFGRIRAIAKDHETCECSAAVMILAVLGDG